jgi:5-carboxymethyl-2-hydroxymuconate semialdehyde dehydrogenase
MDRVIPNASDVFQANRDRAAPLLKQLRADGIGHMIDGKIVPSISGETFETNSPVDGAVLASVARGNAEDIDRAATAAALAFKAWRAMPATMRKKLLHRVADAIEDRADDIAVLECIDTGQAHRFMAKAAIRAAENFRFFADKCTDARDGLNMPSEEHWNVSTRVPIGPVGVITPWNTPFMLSTWKIAPALAAGCTVVLKPAEWSPLSCSLLGDLVGEAGLPPGVFNIVQGIGEEVGAALVSHPDVRRISFTGSPETARSIGVAAARNLVPFTGELGGKWPFLVFADCDLEAAARKAAGQYDDAGQVCLAGTRLLVEEAVAGAFLELFHRFVDEHVLGDPRDDATTVSPLIHAEHFERVAGFVERARANGDEIVRGGRPAERGGLFYEPTLVLPRSNESEIVQREVFGPVLTLQTFSTEEEGVELANSTPYGLSAIVYTGSSARAERVGRAIRAGTVWVNTFLVRDLTAPFGGVGISGIGREGGDYALDFYSDLKTLQIVEGSTT